MPQLHWLEVCQRRDCCGVRWLHAAQPWAVLRWRHRAASNDNAVHGALQCDCQTRLHIRTPCLPTTCGHYLVACPLLARPSAPTLRVRLCALVPPPCDANALVAAPVCVMPPRHGLRRCFLVPPPHPLHFSLTNPRQSTAGSIHAHLVSVAGSWCTHMLGTSPCGDSPVSSSVPPGMGIWRPVVEARVGCCAMLLSREGLPAALPLVWLCQSSLGYDWHCGPRTLMMLFFLLLVGGLDFTSLLDCRVPCLFRSPALPLVSCCSPVPVLCGGAHGVMHLCHVTRICQGAWQTSSVPCLCSEQYVCSHPVCVWPWFAGCTPMPLHVQCTDPAIACIGILCSDWFIINIRHACRRLV